MNKDINIKKTRINCFRQSKIPGEFMLQMRVPGGLTDAKHLSYIQHIAETWGDGTFHFGTRQTFDFAGIAYESIPEVNAYIESYIEDVENTYCQVGMDVDDNGYPTIGARNITACIGNSHCICGSINTHKFASELEKLIFPSHYHIKINISGCPNDCNKAHLSDFGIIGCSKLEYHPERCIGCGTCVSTCEKVATRVLSMNSENRVDKDPCCCVGCAECARVCPTGAWTRKPTKFYKVILGGRTGRQTPRMGKMFLNWATEETIIAVLKNWQYFSSWVMDNKPEYLHGGHLIDRAGYKKFKELILKDVQLNPECLVAEDLFWTETEYRSNYNLKPLEMHKPAGPQA